MQHMIIDVREADEYEIGHVKNSVNLPLGRVMRGAGELDNVPKDTYIIVYCRSGGRADVAAEALKKQSFANVTNGINQEQVESKFEL